MEGLGVFVDRDFIYEKGTLKIPRQSISKITIKSGFLSKHPVLQLILGIITAIFGLLPLYHLYLVEKYGGVFRLWEALGTSFFIIGGYLIISCFRKGYFLEIKTNFGNKRLIFAKGAEKSRIDSIVNYARNLGYPIFSETD